MLRLIILKLKDGTLQAQKLSIKGTWIKETHARNMTNVFTEITRFSQKQLACLRQYYPHLAELAETQRSDAISQENDWYWNSYRWGHRRKRITPWLKLNLKPSTPSRQENKWSTYVLIERTKVEPERIEYIKRSLSFLITGDDGIEVSLFQASKEVITKQAKNNERFEYRRLEQFNKPVDEQIVAALTDWMRINQLTLVERFDDEFMEWLNTQRKVSYA